MNYNDTFAHTITSVFGTRGKQWLNELPTIIDQCAQMWQLTDLKPVDALTYNYVLSGNMLNKPIVLKIRCDHQALEKEVAMLHAYANYGAVKVIAHNYDLGVVLLERIIPGNPLSSLFPHDDRIATAIAAQLVQRIHQAPVAATANLPTLEQLLPTFDKEPDGLKPWIDRARILRSRLLSSTTTPVLLHGDFHQDNILASADEQWIIIDPEGVIGNPIYDIAVYMRNPLDKLITTQHSTAIITNRLQDFATLLGYSMQDIYDWTYLQTLVSAYWSIHDGLDCKRYVTFLKLLDTIPH